jgi:hypothetical protein
VPCDGANRAYQSRCPAWTLYQSASTVRLAVGRLPAYRTKRLSNEI